MIGGAGPRQPGQRPRPGGEQDRPGGVPAPRSWRIACLNQETGIRGYALSARPAFLAPYTDGLAGAAAGQRRCARCSPACRPRRPTSAQVLPGPASGGPRYAEPAIEQVRATGQARHRRATSQGKADFDALRAALNGLQADLASERGQAVAGLNGSAATLNAICLGIGISLLVILIVLAFSLEVSVIRPLSRLAADARTGRRRRLHAPRRPRRPAGGAHRRRST